MDAGFQNLQWLGEGVEEKLIDGNNRVLLEVDPQFFRPGEVPYLLGSYAKIASELGWRPKYNWKDIATEMID